MPLREIEQPDQNIFMANENNHAIADNQCQKWNNCLPLCNNYNSMDMIAVFWVKRTVVGSSPSLEPGLAAIHSQTQTCFHQGHGACD
jgi:hypothetical protein